MEMFSAVLEMMSCSKGSLASSGLLKLDEEKQYHRRRRSSEEQKSARKKTRAIRKGFADTIQQAEVVTYIAGGFSECQKLVFFGLPTKLWYTISPDWLITAQ